jgi:hypothetical protein
LKINLEEEFKNPKIDNIKIDPSSDFEEWRERISYTKPARS